LDIKETIKVYIQKNFSIDELSDSQSLITNGLIDVLGLIELTTFLEDTFNIKIADEEIVSDNFNSLSKLVAFVHCKQP